MKIHRRFTLLIGLGLAGLSVSCGETPPENAELRERLTPIQYKATFAAGCFWCVEAIFERVAGVEEAVSGYAGGDEPNPTYKEVGSGRTGHAEAVEITYDPDEVSYKELLEVFWRSHDATDARGVAPDFGKQYRSALFYRTDEERKWIEESKAAQEKKLGEKVATEVSKLKKFHPAEDYHQDYVKKHPNDPYVRRVSIPRLKETGFKP